MATYPNSIVAFTTKTNKVDLVDASHINSIQAEIVAEQTELGKLLKGTKATLRERLAVSLGGDGTIIHSPSFVSGPVDGQPFYRTDLDTLYIFNGSTWEPAVAGPQNLFSAYNSANQTSIGTVDVDYDTEDFDTGSNFASSTFTAPTSGKYLFTASIEVDFVANSSNAGFSLIVKKNGSQFAVIGGFEYFDGAENDRPYGVGGSIIMSLAASDTVKIATIVNSGSCTIDILHGATKGRFTGMRVSN